MKYIILLLLMPVFLFFSACEKTKKGEVVSKKEYGSDWPYSIESGHLYCDPPGSNVVLESNGNVYALNGRAMGNAKKKSYLIARNTITLKDDDGFFTIGNPNKIIRRGLAMCK